MPITERGYRKWAGSLKSSRLNWLPVLLNGIRHVREKKRAKLLYFFSSFPFLVFFLAIYISTKPELKFLKNLTDIISSDADFFKTFYTFGGLIFIMLIWSIYAGSDLIAADIKFNSLSLYLSRPFSRMDYLLGKFSIVMFFLLLFTLFPALLLILTKIVFTGKVSISLVILFKVIFFPILSSGTMALLILMFSSLSSNPRFVILSFIGFYFISNLMAALLAKAIFKSDYFMLLSVDQNIRHFGQYLFSGKSDLAINGWFPGLALFVFATVSAAILSFRIKRVEI